MRTHGRGREPGVRPNSYLSMSVRLLTLYRMSRAARSENAMKLRWADVRARRFHDEGRGVWRFRKRWEAPSSLRYRRTRRTRRLSCLCGRRHETGGNTGAWTCRPGGSGRNSTHHLWNYRPTLSLYTRTGLAICGSKPPPPAGYGFVAVRGGRDHKKGDAVLVAKRCGQVTAGMRNVKTVTSNLAELVAFTRALQWATHTRYAAGRPICIRYDST